MGDMTPVRLTLEGSEAGFATTEVDALLGWARKYSLFAYPFVTACCGMEFMALTSPRFDIARFGAEAPALLAAPERFALGRRHHQPAPSARAQAHLRADDGAEVGARVRHVRVAAAASTTTTRPCPGIDKIIPTDVYIPGCPPRPEAVLDGLMLLQDKIARNERAPGIVKPRFDPVETAGLVQLRSGLRRSRPRAGAERARARQHGARGGSVSQLVLEKLKERFGAAILETHSSTATTRRSSSPSQWKATSARSCGKTRRWHFDMLGRPLRRSITPTGTPRLEVVMHLYSISMRHRIRVEGARRRRRHGRRGARQRHARCGRARTGSSARTCDMSGVHVRGPPRPAPHPDVSRVRGAPAPQGLSGGHDAAARARTARRTRPGCPLDKLAPFRDGRRDALRPQSRVRRATVSRRTRSELMEPLDIGARRRRARAPRGADAPQHGAVASRDARHRAHRPRALAARRS